MVAWNGDDLVDIDTLDHKNLLTLCSGNLQSTEGMNCTSGHKFNLMVHDCYNTVLGSTALGWFNWKQLANQQAGKAGKKYAIPCDTQTMCFLLGSDTQKCHQKEHSEFTPPYYAEGFFVKRQDQEVLTFACPMMSIFTTEPPMEYKCNTLYILVLYYWVCSTATMWCRQRYTSLGKSVTKADIINDVCISLKKFFNSFSDYWPISCYLPQAGCCVAPAHKFRESYQQD